MADDANAAGYSEHEDIQRMIDQEIERNGEEYVANNIDQLLAGLGPIMSVPDKSELDIPEPSDS